MKIAASKLLLLTATLTVALGARAQAPASAPAGANGICKDGTYSTAASKDGACRGHKGVQTWYSPATATTKGSPAAAAIAPAPPAATRGTVNQPTPAAPLPPSQAKAPAPTRGAVAPPVAAGQPTAPAAKSGISAERAKLATMQPAAGGGPGLVWLNGSSKVYHCPGSEFYGKTKTGAYLPEADAKAKGAHADHNKPCG